jgi:Na+/phosphate symporter
MDVQSVPIKNIKINRLNLLLFLSAKYACVNRQLRKISVCTFLLSITAGCYASDGFPAGRGMVLLVSGLVGGLGLFLMGIKMMSDSLTKSTGNQIRNLLARITQNRFVAFLTGIITTMVFQSSSATTVMLVSFVNSRLMKFRDTVGIILGASVGATVTIQLIAFRLTDYSLNIIAIGLLLYIISKQKKIKRIRITILGYEIMLM